MRGGLQNDRRETPRRPHRAGQAHTETHNAPTPERHGPPGDNWLTVIGRLKPGESLDSARANLQATAQIVHEEADPSHQFMGRLQLHVESGRSGRSFLRADYSQPLLILEVLVGLLLLLCCANAALLMLARVTGRFREFAVRGALGASRGRLLRQMLTEVGILAVCGLGLGIWLGWAAARSLVSMLGSIGQLPALDVAPQTAILAFAAGATLVSVLGAGLWPALRASRVDPALDLKRSEAVSSFSSKRLGTWIVPAQVAVSITLLTSAVLLGGTFIHLLSEHAGFRPDGVTFATVDLGSVKPTEKQAARDVQGIVKALNAAPGAETSTILSVVPISGGWTTSHYFSLGRHGAIHTDMRTWIESGSPDYFEVMGTKILEGRAFTHADESGARVCVLSSSAAAYFFPDEDAVGRFVYSGGEDPQKDGQDLDPRNACRVIGVSEDARFLSLREAPPRMLYNLAGDDWGTQASFAVRSSSTSLAAAAIRNAVRKQVPGVPDPEIFTFNELIKNNLEKERMLMSLSVSFGCVALLLIALGLYGVLARSVTLRTKEIGLRLAFGAQPRDVVMQIIRRGLHLVVVGVIVGVAIALPSMHLLKGLLFGIASDNPVVFVMVVVLVFTGGLPGGVAKLGRKLSPVTLSQHFDTFLHTYVPTQGKKSDVQEDTLDCPLVELGLIRRAGEHSLEGSDDRETVYAFDRDHKEDITGRLFVYCLHDYWSKCIAHESTLQLSHIANGRYSPGRIFQLSEWDVRERLEHLEEDSGGAFSFEESALFQRIIRTSGSRHRTCCQRYIRVRLRMPNRRINSALRFERRFLRSIQLERDYRDPSSLAGYVVTDQIRSCVLPYGNQFSNSHREHTNVFGDLF